VLTEKEVVEAIAHHLERESYTDIVKRLPTEHGIDVVAFNPKTGRHLLIEAKGATSTRKSSARFGDHFLPQQVRSHVARAFYAAAVALQNEDHHNADSAIALPASPQHRTLIDRVGKALDRLGITVFFVHEDEERSVEIRRPSRGQGG
jgi:hypothetical protein